MGLFGKLFRRKWKKKKKHGDKNKRPTDGVTKDTESLTKASSSSSQNEAAKKNKKITKLGSFRSTEVTLDHLPDLILDLESGTQDGSNKARTTKALKMLFTLSEQPESHNRIEMARYENGKLIAELLDVLGRCSSQKSNEKYMALLVLNNISIPAENKQAIAIAHDAARVLSKLLCDDPSCHLIAIILVNLSYAEPEVLEKLVSLDAQTGLVEALLFVLHISSWSTEEFLEHRAALDDAVNSQMTPQERLGVLIQEEERRTYDSDNIFVPGQEKYPETARWCLSALKNLCRVLQNPSAMQSLVHSVMMNNILKYISLPDGSFSNAESQGSDSSSSTPVPRDPVNDDIDNSPRLWVSNSKQDTALYIVVNLCACSHSRLALKESETFDVLLQILDHAKASKKNLSAEELSQQEWQYLKARMAIGYLCGSEGYFGHEKIKSTSSSVAANAPESPLVMNESSAQLLVELLARTLHSRGKEGPAGYSSTTMNVEQVLFALRCLLTHTANQQLLARVAGRILNSLLLKTIAIHTLRSGVAIDSKATEHACFSLYLLSNYGFKNPFLPSWLNDENELQSMSAKVIKSYLDTPSITPLGKHSAEQLLFRLKFLKFEGEVSDLVPQEGENVKSSDLLFEPDLLEGISAVQLRFLLHGARPKKDISNRPILRRRKPKDGNTDAPWDNSASVVAFSSALQAVQQLSYGSAKVHHVDGIDDVMIANNLAKCANGQRSEAYGFMWAWEDTAKEVQLGMKNRGAVTPSLQESVVPAATFASNDTSSTIFSRIFICGNVEHTA